MAPVHAQSRFSLAEANGHIGERATGCGQWLVALVARGLAFSASSAQSKGTDAQYNPTKDQCIAKAQSVDDAVLLSQRSASEINELDWELSICAAKFLPLKPQGAMLISEAHGVVADESRKRMEKAVETLSPQEQRQFWDAFNTDPGDSGK